MGLRRRRNRGGFTLVEILIALALATLGLLGLMALQIITLRGNTASRQFIEAVSLAQEQLEASQVVQYANLPTVAGVNVPLTATGSLNSYLRTTTVAAGASTTNITVLVTWVDPDNGRTHSITMITTRSP
jgi:prepilin-type N-terminal cleavage/methylation domain-containing protein